MFYIDLFIKGNVKNLQVSDSGPLWPSCFYIHLVLPSAYFYEEKITFFLTNSSGNFKEASVFLGCFFFKFDSLKKLLLSFLVYRC